MNTFEKNKVVYTLYQLFGVLMTKQTRLKKVLIT